MKIVVCGFLLLAAHVRAASPDELLMQEVRQALDAVASASGRPLYGEVDTGYAESNFLIVLGISLASLGFVASAPASALPSSRMALAKAVAGGSAAVGGVHYIQSCTRDPFMCAAWMAPNKHFRIELHYALSETEEGSCLLFFSFGRRRGAGRLVEYEIDWYSHGKVFPETVPGVLRIGGREDWMDGWMGQRLVVAYGSFEVD